jgi:hypothetical protein
LCTACRTLQWLRTPFQASLLISVLGASPCGLTTPATIAGSGARPFTGTLRSVCEFLRRKEVIQPQVPLRLPCYDFIPVTSYTLGPYPLAVGTGTSGATGFHDVTGGVYKTRERIHGAVDDAPLLAIPTSWRRVAASNPN